MTEKWVTEAPPLCYTLNFGDAGDDAVVEGKRGQKNKQKKNMGTWLWISTFIDWGKGERRQVPSFPPPPESYTYMGDGRATVQQDTLVSIGNRCHNTFHLHLHTGREQVEMRVFWSSVLMVDEGGAEVKTQSSFIFQLQDKENSLWSKKVFFF